MNYVDPECVRMSLNLEGGGRRGLMAVSRDSQSEKNNGYLSQDEAKEWPLFER